MVRPGQAGWLLGDDAARRARDVTAGRVAAVAARQAATVVLLREGPAGTGGPEAFLVERHARMAFAPGMLAFPGGAVEPGEGDGLPGAVTAAVREVDEEIGVTLQGDQLVPVARWITPEFEARRFDTWFFVARLPAGQEPGELSGEAAHGFWGRPDAVLAAVEAGELQALPPTLAALEIVAGHPHVAAALAAAAGCDLEPVLPTWVDDGDAVRLVLPADPPGDA